jgi:hypothetical protein
MKTEFSRLVGLALVMAALPVLAAPPVGRILKLGLRDGGEVQVRGVDGKTRSSRTSALEANSPLYRGDSILTRGNARVQIAFLEGKDGEPNLVVLGADASLTIDEAASSDELRKGRKGTRLSLHEGEVRSSVRARYKGEGSDVYEVRTPNAVAGVRGTQFTVSYDGLSKKTNVAVTEGAVDLSSLAKVSIERIQANSMAGISGNSPVEKPRPVPEAQRQLLVPAHRLDPAAQAPASPARGASLAPPMPPPGSLGREPLVPQVAGERALPSMPPRNEIPIQRPVAGSAFATESSVLRDDVQPKAVGNVDRFSGSLPSMDIARPAGSPIVNKDPVKGAPPLPAAGIPDRGGRNAVPVSVPDSRTMIGDVQRTVDTATEVTQPLPGGGTAVLSPRTAR